VFAYPLNTDGADDDDDEKHDLPKTRNAIAVYMPFITYTSESDYIWELLLDHTKLPVDLCRLTRAFNGSFVERKLRVVFVLYRYVYV
jgi:hypothetical protein